MTVRKIHFIKPYKTRKRKLGCRRKTAGRAQAIEHRTRSPPPASRSRVSLIYASHKINEERGGRSHSGCREIKLTNFSLLKFLQHFFSFLLRFARRPQTHNSWLSARLAQKTRGGKNCSTWKFFLGFFSSTMRGG